VSSQPDGAPLRLDSFVMRGKPAPVDVNSPGRGSTWRETPSCPTSTTWVILDETQRGHGASACPRRQRRLHAQCTSTPAVDVILTGRYAPKAIVDIADTVSEVKEIKHHYSQGIKEERYRILVTI